MNSFWFLGGVVQVLLFGSFAQSNNTLLEVRLQEGNPAKCPGVGLTIRLGGDFQKNPALRWPVMYGAAARIMSRVDCEYYFPEDEKVLFNLNMDISPSQWAFGEGKVEDLRLALVKDGYGFPVWYISGGTEGISIESLTSVLKLSNSKILHFMRTDKEDKCTFCDYEANPNITKTLLNANELLKCQNILERVRSLQQAEKAALIPITTSPSPSTLITVNKATEAEQESKLSTLTTTMSIVATRDNNNPYPTAVPYNDFNTHYNPYSQMVAQPIIQPVMYVPYVPAGIMSPNMMQPNMMQMDGMSNPPYLNLPPPLMYNVPMSHNGMSYNGMSYNGNPQAAAIFQQPEQQRDLPRSNGPQMATVPVSVVSV